MRRTALITALLTATSCAPPLEADDAGIDDDAMIDEMGGPQVEHTELGDDVVSTQVDATAEGTWVYLDLDDGRQLEVADPQADPEWDLAFQRFHIKLNGGVSGGADVQATPVEGTTFEALTTAPANGYLADQADGDDDDDDPDYVLREWYDYDFMTHVLTPAAVVYVVRHGSGHTKLQLDSYYDDAGTSGFVTFRWAPLASP